MNFKETPTLFLEFHGSSDTIDSQVKLISNLILFSAFYWRNYMYILIIKRRYVFRIIVSNLIGQPTLRREINSGTLGITVGLLLSRFILVERFKI